MPQLGTFKAAVLINGMDLPEYGVKTDHATKTTTCWIPSEAGKEFKVECKNVHSITADPTGNLRLAGFLKVDGKESGSAWLTGIKGESICVHEVVTSATTSRNIMFSSIELTDDDAFLNSERTKDLGDIALRIQLVACEGRHNYASDETPDSDGKVHERSKKTVAHCVKLGDMKVHAPKIQMKSRPVQTLATFIFKYRSIDILRADGIAPPESAAQKSSGIKRKASDEVEVWERDDVKKELKVLRGKVNDLEKILENQDTKPQPKKKTKRENRPVMISGEIHDLT